MKLKKRIVTIILIALLCSMCFVFGPIASPYNVLIDQPTLKEFNRAFKEIPHPRETILVDSVSTIIKLYPFAAAGSARTQCSYLIGELRQSNESVDELGIHYHNISLDDDLLTKLPVHVLPINFFDNGHLIEIEPKDAKGPWEADILKGIHSYYAIRGVPDNLPRFGNNLYLVFIIDEIPDFIWRKRKCF